VICAIVKDGIIQPLEPLPPEWQNGHEVRVGEVAEQQENGADDFDRWVDDMNKLTAQLDDPREWEQIEAVLAEADRQNKALVRREMGLLWLKVEAE
jgi:hypothetical protein